MNIQKLQDKINNISSTDSTVKKEELIQDLIEILDFKYNDKTHRFRIDIDNLKNKIYSKMKGSGSVIGKVPLNISFDLKTEVERKFAEQAVNELINEGKLVFENNMIKLII